MNGQSRSLVLSGGGVAGEAWMLGLMDGLRRDGVDLRDADLVVGTSGGARAGAQLAAGHLQEAVEDRRRHQAPQIVFPARLNEWVAASLRAATGAADEQEAARRIANLEPLGSRLVPVAERKRVIAAGLQNETWPEKRVLITAVEAGSGARVAFDADCGVDLLDALTASGALPGIMELVPIGGRRYADGGAYSLYNADLAAGHDIVAVISPIPLNDYLKGKLYSELETLGEATVRLIVPDPTSLAAIGADPLSADAVEPSLDAGAAQAERESEALGAAWEGQPG